MDIEEATIDDIIEELRSRPLTFVLAAIEEPREGESWVKWSADQDPLHAINFFAQAANYLYEMTEWD